LVIPVVDSFFQYFITSLFMSLSSTY
jgi:hypothetical protein